MSAFDQNRPSFLLDLGSLGIIPAVPRDFTGTQPTPPQAGYVLYSSEGEHLIHFRDQGNVFIKLGSATGSDNLALGTQQVMAGSGIPIHRHFHMDEAFHILGGSGTVTLNEFVIRSKRARRCFRRVSTGRGSHSKARTRSGLNKSSRGGPVAYMCSRVHAGAQPIRDHSREQVEASIAKRFVPAGRERNPTCIPVAETLPEKSVASHGVLAEPMRQELFDEGP